MTKLADLPAMWREREADLDRRALLTSEKAEQSRLYSKANSVRHCHHDFDAALADLREQIIERRDTLPGSSAFDVGVACYNQVLALLTQTLIGECNHSLGPTVRHRCAKGTVGCTSGHDGATYTRPDAKLTPTEQKESK